MKYQESTITVLCLEGADAEKVSQRLVDDSLETVEYIRENDKKADVSDLKVKTNITVVRNSN